MSKCIKDIGFAKALLLTERVAPRLQRQSQEPIEVHVSESETDSEEEISLKDGTIETDNESRNGRCQIEKGSEEDISPKNCVIEIVGNENRNGHCQIENRHTHHNVTFVNIDDEKKNGNGRIEGENRKQNVQATDVYGQLELISDRYKPSSCLVENVDSEQGTKFFKSKYPYDYDEIRVVADVDYKQNMTFAETKDSDSNEFKAVAHENKIGSFIHKMKIRINNAFHSRNDAPTANGKVYKMVQQIESGGFVKGRLALDIQRTNSKRMYNSLDYFYNARYSKQNGKSSFLSEVTECNSYINLQQEANNLATDVNQMLALKGITNDIKGLHNIGDSKCHHLDNNEDFGKMIEINDTHTIVGAKHHQLDYNGNSTTTLGVAAMSNNTTNSFLKSIESSEAQDDELNLECSPKHTFKKQRSESIAKESKNTKKDFLISGERRHSFGSLKEFKKSSAIEIAYLRDMKPSMKTVDGKIWHIQNKQREVKRLAQLSTYSRSRDNILPTVQKTLEKNLCQENTTSFQNKDEPPDANQNFLFEYRTTLKSLLEPDKDPNTKTPEIRKMDNFRRQQPKKFKPLAAKICRLCGVRCKNFVSIGQAVIIKLVAVNLPVIVIEGDRLRIGLCQTCDENLTTCSSFMMLYIGQCQEYDQNLEVSVKCFVCNCWQSGQLEEADMNTLYILSIIFEAFPSDYWKFYGGRRFLCKKCRQTLKLLEMMQERICLTNKIFEDAYHELYDTEVYCMYAPGTTCQLPPPPNNTPVTERKASIETDSGTHDSMVTMIDMESEYMDEMATAPELIKKTYNKVLGKFRKKPQTQLTYQKRNSTRNRYKEDAPGLFDVILSPIVDPIRATRKALFSTGHKKRATQAVPLQEISVDIDGEFHKQSSIFRYRNLARPASISSLATKHNSLSRNSSQYVSSERGEYKASTTSSKSRYWTTEEMANYFMD